MIVRSILAMACVALAVAACDATCPGEFDPADNPAGESCTIDTDCRVECVCEDADGDEIGALSGACTNGVCEDATELCPEACGSHPYTGEFCR